MSPTIEEQIERLKSTIADMEAQREALGDTVVQKAIDPLREKLEELNQLFEVSQASPLDKPTQQRKLLTMMFMDVAGSTAIAQHMDPEDMNEVFDLSLKKLGVPVEAHGGHVIRFMGDGFLAVFGAPQASEDDPERAVRAGLQIVELSQQLATELGEKWGIPGFQVRVGVNTGLVMLGGETEAEYTVMGPAVNLAARLESAAPPGGVLISHETYRHIRGVFDVEPWEPLKLKGFDEPVQVYRILRARPRAFRSYTRGVEGVETRMVGREAELKILQNALLSTIEDVQGQMITITGEAGVGKSRLLYEFQNWIELLPPAVRFYEGRSRREAQGLPYGLLRNLFEFRFQIQDDDSMEAAREKIQSGFAEGSYEGEEGGASQMRAHILGQWLGFNFSSSPHLVSVLNDPEQLRNRGMMYLSEYFQKVSGWGPVVVFLEDIHWADDSSLDVLNWLGERLQKQCLLIVCAARPLLFERRPYWGEGLAYHNFLELKPLSKSESRQLVGDILKLADQVPTDLRELVVEGAEGNPFYLEELVKMLVEDGIIVKGEETWHVHAERLAQLEVPPTLAGVLQARLDSLTIEERSVLQQAAVVGRLFWDQLVAYLQASEGGRPQVVPEALSSLRDREMVYRREASAFVDAREYLFKHDILREVTYETVLKRLRRVYHGLVADWLISQGAGRMDEYTGLIAHHLLQAGRKEQASQYFVQAGGSALASYANGEAEAHFRKGLELSADLTLRAACLAGLGETLGRQGLREEAVQKLREAIDLYVKLGEHDRVATLYTHMAQFLWHTDYQKAWDVSQEGLRRLSGAADSPGLAYLLAEAGRNAFFRVQPKENVISLCMQAIEVSERLGLVEPKADASITLALMEDDTREAIDVLQKAVALCEMHELLRTASRAHFNLAYLYWISLSGAQAFQHYMKSAEISRQIGNIDGMIMALGYAILPRVLLGHLNSVEDFIVAFLQQSGATDVQVKEFLHRMQGYISDKRGNWKQTLEFGRHHLEQLRKGGSLQLIAEENTDLAYTILEMHRFTHQDHLEEAEAGLKENLTFHWMADESQLMLAIISVYKGHLEEAQEYLARAVQTAQRMTKEQESIRLRAKAEFALAEGRWGDAITTWQALVDIYQAGGYRWFWARQLIDLGDAFIGRNGPGDRELAQEAYQQSLEMFTEMGAEGYIQVLEERLGRL